MTSRADNEEQTGDPALAPLEEGIDYYVEEGLFVFTAHFLRKRGYCCESGCRNCPYEETLRKANCEDLRD